MEAELNQCSNGGQKGAGNIESSKSMSKSRTILWCVPRSVSTALTKCLSSVEEMEVWFEPFTYCCMARTLAQSLAGIELPRVYEGNEEAYDSVVKFFDATQQSRPENPENISYSSICRFLEASTSPHVFVKDMALAMHPDDFRYIPKSYRHTFLIRHPLRVFASYRKAMYAQLCTQGILVGEAADPVTFDIGRHVPFVDPTKLVFKDLYDVWNYVREHFDTDPIVIDGDDLLRQPAKMLPKYCRAVGLPYDESMLRWNASTDVLNKWKVPTKGMVEKYIYVYQRAAESSEFLPPGDMPSRDQVTPDVIRCADHVMEYYKEMFEARLKI